MERYKKIIASTSPILKLIEEGFTPDEIKEGVIELLNPYFENKKLLNTFAIEQLIADSITLEKIKEDGRFVGVLEKILLIYRLALKKEPTSCYQSIELLEPSIAESQVKFWSILNLEVDKGKLPLYEFLHECLRNIGDFIEGLAKPYLRSLLLQIRITEGMQNSLTNIDQLDLGEIIDELIRKTDFVDFFSPAPWNIRLNQWRNIAHHESAKIENNQIICWYGRAPNIKEARLTREELMSAVKTLYLVFIVLKMAYSLFIFDNIEDISKHVLFSEAREEVDFVPFAAGLASQGFEILNYDVSAEKASLVVKDHASLDIKRRKIHASQFLFPLWLQTNSRTVFVEYCENDGITRCIFTIDTEVCRKYSEGSLDLEELAMAVQRFEIKKDG